MIQKLGWSIFSVLVRCFYQIMKKMKNYNLKEIKNIISLPLNELIFKAQKVHKKYFKKNDIQLASLISVKTGSCPEDCKYCPQSAHYNVDLQKEKLIEVNRVKKAAEEAKARVLTDFVWALLGKKSLRTEISILFYK